MHKVYDPGLWLKQEFELSVLRRLKSQFSGRFKRYVFNSDLKHSSDLIARMFGGSLFHNFGAAAENERSP